MAITILITAAVYFIGMGVVLYLKLNNDSD